LHCLFRGSSVKALTNMVSSLQAVRPRLICPNKFEKRQEHSDQYYSACSRSKIRSKFIGIFCSRAVFVPGKINGVSSLIFLKLTIPPVAVISKSKASSRSRRSLVPNQSRFCIGFNCSMMVSGWRIFRSAGLRPHRADCGIFKLFVFQKLTNKFARGSFRSSQPSVRFLFSAVASLT